MTGEPKAWKCCKCNEQLVQKNVVLSYLGYTVAHELPTCPKCGKVFVSKELAEGKMSEVEQMLEDK